MKLTINGNEHDIADAPDRPLLWVIRDELGLTGTKYGCGEGVCGCCEVHLDGAPTRSCVTRLSEVRGRTIRTVEGLERGGGRLHPVQAAFLDEQAFQCGFCTSGHIMRAVAFLEAHPAPTREDVAAAMVNACRCGVHGRIERAVLRASRTLAEQSGAEPLRRKLP